MNGYGRVSLITPITNKAYILSSILCQVADQNGMTPILLLRSVSCSMLGLRHLIQAQKKANAEETLCYVGWAGALILVARFIEMLDGQVARLGNMSSRLVHCMIRCWIDTVNW